MGIPKLTQAKRVILPVGGEFDSTDPNGEDAPTPPPEGDVVLTGTIAEGETVTITTDGSIDFGNGPIVQLATKLTGTTLGEEWSTTDFTEGLGSFTAGENGTPIVEAAADMPYGRGMVIGTYSNTMAGTRVFAGYSDAAVPDAGEFVVSIDYRTIKLHKTDNAAVDQSTELALFAADDLTFAIRNTSDSTKYLNKPTVSVTDSGDYYTILISTSPTRGTDFAVDDVCTFVTNSDGGVYPRISMDFTGNPTKKVFESCVIHWPTTHQENCVPFLLKNINCRWGVKEDWNFFENDFGAGEVNFFAGKIGSYFNTGDSWDGTTLSLSTNSLITRYATFPSGENLTQRGGVTDGPIQRDRPYIMENFFDLGTSPTSLDGQVWTRVVDTTYGQITDSRQTGLDMAVKVPSGPNPEDRFYVDTCNFPGFARGFPVQQNGHYYQGMKYRAIGVGALARVGICSTPNFYDCPKPVIWPTSEWDKDYAGAGLGRIIATVWLGFYDSEDLPTLYIFGLNESGEQIISVLIGDLL